jgi:hypothetical protein
MHNLRINISDYSKIFLAYKDNVHKLGTKTSIFLATKKII